MPFKSGKSPSDVSRKIKDALERELPKDIERGLYTMYTVLGGASDYYVPVDTNNLVRSRDQTVRIRKEQGGWRLTYGYFAYTEDGFDYAKYLHETTDWKPKPPGSQGKQGGGYNPNAQPDWLNLGWRDAGQRAISAFAKKVEPK